MISRRKHGTLPQRRLTYSHVFVDTLPDKLDEGTLYVCVKYATSAHNCLCGCGREVVTPIHPTKWQLNFDGINVSLYPSVGSWSLACKSHYWLQSGRVSWADSWSDDEIQAARSRDLAAQDNYFGKLNVQPTSPKTAAAKPASLWRAVADWFQEK
jgi:hypothetical protein